MEVKFTYKDKEGSVELDNFAGVKSLKYDGQTGEKAKGGFDAGGQVFLVKKKYGLIPFLQVEEDTIQLVEFSTLEWVFVFLPLANVILTLGGVVPIIVSLLGIGLNMNFFMKPGRGTGVKIAFSIANTIVGLVITFSVAIGLAVLLS